MFLWLRILVHEIGHYLTFRFLGYRPTGIWVGRCPSDEERWTPNPGNRVWFPGDREYNGGGTVFIQKMMVPILHRDAIYVSGPVADFLFLLIGFVTAMAGEAVMLVWFAKGAFLCVANFVNHVLGPFFTTPMLTVAEAWLRILVVGGIVGVIVTAAASAKELGAGDIALLRFTHCGRCGEYVPKSNYCEQCGAPMG